MGRGDFVNPYLGSGPTCHTAEAAKWQSYRATMHAGDSIAIFKGILVREGRRFTVHLDLTDFAHFIVEKP